jgi:hypothetical protein
MTSEAYMLGRKKYQRPQAMLWSENSGTLVDGLYVPTGLEVNADPGTESSQLLSDRFIILSDDNRSTLDFKPQRIENRKRMANGRMRSYHIADKMSLSTSWEMLPSRSYALRPDYNLEDGKSPYANDRSMEYTTDGGAGGVDLLKWYENHKGSFWVYLAYDKFSVFGEDDAAYAHLPQYNQLIEMFISDFSYSVVRRGALTHDFWNISVTLEEV